jgi:FixJ family two-component response regulator
VGAERILPVVRTAMQVDADRRSARCELDELRGRFDKLTHVERAIFDGIMRNRLNKQLAVELGACERTIKAQRARMMAKLKVSSLPELVCIARVLELGDRAPEIHQKHAWQYDAAHASCAAHQQV